MNGIAEQKVRRLMKLQGTMASAQIISLLRQWTDLLERLRKIENPVVPHPEM